MPVPTINGLPPYPKFEDVVNKINQLVNELRMLLLNLDTLNVVSLNAQVIESETITGDKIAANTITADKMNVNELSAISANLGEITAGKITTNAEIDVGTDAKIGRYLYLNVNDTTSPKGIIFHDDGNTIAAIDVTSGDIEIRSSGFVLLNGGSGVFANGGRVATTGISVQFEVLSSDGVTPIELTFIDGVLKDID